ncbi:hypothetical protein ABFY60_11160 [Lysinibacillus pakistanensis]|uniref:hypothetical protein n=1 Tax=Lysinibacillus pakistanensis TaxID=759811 RepID=UPI003D26AC21
MDSQASVSILNQVFGYEQNCYADRNGFYMIDWNIEKHIGVDLALHGDRMCYDNHVTMSTRNDKVNPNSANINAIYKISQDNYTQKCAFSTLLQVMSLLDYPLPKTDEGKAFLLSIDSAYLGYYSDRFKDMWLYYMEKLGYTELIDLVKKYSKNDIASTKIDERLTFENGILTFDKEKKEYAERLLEYEIYLPQQKFTERATFQSNYAQKQNGSEILNNNMLFSLAMTSAKNISYSVYSTIH